MPIQAFKGGVSIIDEATLNSLISLQPFALIYDGNQVDGLTGTGISELDCSGYDRAFYFTALGVTEISRVEFELVGNGIGADVIIELRSGLVSDGSTEGTLLTKMVLPKEFLPGAKAYVSIPFDAVGLVSSARYWLVVRGAGDASNHFHLIGETSSNANYPCYYRSGATGSWTLGPSGHFKVFSGESGELKHGMYGSGFTTIEYSNELISKVYRYLPPMGTTQGGIRDILVYQWKGEYLKRGVI
ncbi:hypothetical protein H1S01_15315 [Heliobacterium chlorum]|uniref:Uncharacterized protein n=1 Tax=Heliobacterium chlorum TaxID=2698 RepID=A0ABR7T4Y5_HELCL|nr:hypothetical protein [Heliobacterium chlorum]MBC9785854.1 hypothetical protein [Heliobacterium chlorum]